MSVTNSCHYAQWGKRLQLTTQSDLSAKKRGVMFSIKGTYENGKIKLLEPINIGEDTNVIITFLDHDIPFSTDRVSVSSPTTTLDDGSIAMDSEEQPEDYYEKLREHKRYKATGNITIVGGHEEETFPLNDYSSGGLSFVSSRVFMVSEEITATLKYTAGEEMLVMDFNMEVRGVFEQDDGIYKIGCQFDDTVDEQLWHTVMS
jgi:PilZ domain-containing protein